MSERTKWTVLTYIAAHNNLAYFGKQSLFEILGVGSDAGVTHGVLYDYPGGAARYIMGSPGKVQFQEQLGSFDSGDPDVLIETAKWLFARRPAQRYGLVLWSHGTAWEPSEIENVTREARPEARSDGREAAERALAPGARVLFRSTLRSLLKPDQPAERAILFDDGTGHSLDTLELARVAGAIAAAVGQPIDLLGMDACLMANLEVAYELRGKVRYLAASEELVPAHSWPYTGIFGGLRTNPEMSGADLARLVVEQYVTYYKEHPPGGGDVTKIALDLSQGAELAGATARLVAALCAEMDLTANALWEAQRQTQDRESRSGARYPNKFQYHLWDLRTIAAGLAASTQSPEAVKNAAAAAVVALEPGKAAVLSEGHDGAWFGGIGGVTVYLMPPGLQRISPVYSQVAFARDTKWNEMLAAYHQRLSGV
jgi:hypothetical protein